VLSFERLTDRELEVLQALADGLSDKEISERFHVGTATVRTHVTSILAKLKVASRLQALVLAVRHGIVKID
jgi:two-component system nitrate/nitrite response regulator NarL